jgi:small subunit ribosomal protein S15e
MPPKQDFGDLVQTGLTEEQAAKKAKADKKFMYRGVPLEKLLDLSNAELMELFNARQRRKFSRGVSRAPATLLKKLRIAKKDTLPGEKPTAVKTHLRNMVIVPEMVGSMVGIYNGKQFINAEMKAEMIGTQLFKDVVSPKLNQPLQTRKPFPSPQRPSVGPQRPSVQSTNRMSSPDRESRPPPGYGVALPKVLSHPSSQDITKPRKTVSAAPPVPSSLPTMAQGSVNMANLRSKSSQSSGSPLASARKSATLSEVEEVVETDAIKEPHSTEQAASSPRAAEGSKTSPSPEAAGSPEAASSLDAPAGLPSPATTVGSPSSDGKALSKRRSTSSSRATMFLPGAHAKASRKPQSPKSSDA